MEGQNLTTDIEKPDPSKVSLAELSDKVDACLAKRIEYLGKKKEQENAYSELKQMQGEVIAILEAQGLDSFKTSKCGFSYHYKESFQTPKTLEEKKKLADYIKEKYGEEIFWEKFGINSKTLQSFAKAELQEAEDNDDFDFELPGCVRTTTDPIASLRATGK